MLASSELADVTLLSSVKKLRSHTIRIGLTYEGNRAKAAPSSLIIKMGHPAVEGRPSTNRHEIAFYRDIAPTLPKRARAALLCDLPARLRQVHGTWCWRI